MDSWDRADVRRPTTAACHRASFAGLRVGYRDNGKSMEKQTGHEMDSEVAYWPYREIRVMLLLGKLLRSHMILDSHTSQDESTESHESVLNPKPYSQNQMWGCLEQIFGF